MDDHVNGRKVEAPSKVMPTFLIIGAQKCGTTALYHYLSQHPDVFMSPVKEPNFFAFENKSINFCDADGRSSPITSNSTTELSAYQALFNDWNGEKAVGEASPHYLYISGSADSIKRHIPAAKLIAILRNPIDRAYSAYLHARRAGREPIGDLYQALRTEKERIRTNHGYIYHYTNTGYYHKQLLEYYRIFNKEQIRVYLYDDFEQDAKKTIQDMYSFIDVDPTFAPDVSRQYNRSGVPKNVLLHSIYQCIGTQRGLYQYVPSYIRSVLPTDVIRDVTMSLLSKNLYKPPLAPECREFLRSAFESDIIGLQNLLERDLSHWLK